MWPFQSVASLIYTKCISYLRELLSSANKEVLLASILVLFSLGLLLFLQFRMQSLKQQKHKQLYYGLLFDLLATLPFIGSFWTKSNAGSEDEQHTKSGEATRRMNISAETTTRTTKLSTISPQCDPEVIIVGSGVLGSALAAVLARDGRKVTVIEKDLKEPTRLAGEVLQPGGYDALKDLGLEEAVDEIDACKITDYTLTDLGSKIKAELACLKTAEGQAIGILRTFHHRRFVIGLRTAAMAEPNAKFIEGKVLQLLKEDDRVVGVSYKDKETGDIKKLHAPLTVVADGIFSNLRKKITSSSGTLLSHTVVCILKDWPHFKSNHFEIYNGKSFTVGLYPISSNETRLVIDIIGEKPKNLKEHLIEKVCPYLPEHMQEPLLNAIQYEGFKVIPMSNIPPKPVNKAGVLLLGDAYNKRHPIAAAGMTVILKDIKIWRQLLLDMPDLYDDSALLQAKKTFYSTRSKSYSFAMNISSQLLFEILYTKDDDLSKLYAITVSYMGKCSSDINSPFEFVFRMASQPTYLIRHSFGVARHIIYFNLKKSDSWINLPWELFKWITTLCKLYSLIFLVIYSEIMYILY